MYMEARLTGSERDFFEALDRVVYGNPFDDARAELIGRLVPAATPAQLAADREALASVVQPRLAGWLDPGRRHTLAAEDERIVESACLYVCYHRHVPAIDSLIAQQVSRGEPPATDVLADHVISDVVELGLTEEAAAHYFAFFFQLRRAFHFIVRDLPGDCGAMRALRRQLWNSVFTHDMRIYQGGLFNRMEEFSTLLLGETGTGKGAAAAAIGRSQFIPYLPNKKRFAASFSNSFISINLAQFPDTLIESELFGHRKGAFTGAISDHAGVFSRCNEYGALFLDEIGEVSIPVQIKMLRVLQERTFTPVGGHETARFAGRLIVATNRPLAELRSGNRFRDDFYYRLCSDIIAVPTLRERISQSRGEIQVLVRVLLTRVLAERRVDLETRVLEALERDVPRDYAWPGNVRELEQGIRRILLTGHFAVQSAELAAEPDQQLSDLVKSGALSAEELLNRYCALLYRHLGTYAEVAARTGLDRRTARRHVVEGLARPS